MNKAKGTRLYWGALLLGIGLLGAQPTFAQVSGRVIEGGGPGGAPVSSATVEVWNSYPGGSIQLSTVTNGSGEFALGAAGGGTVDVRVWKDGYYPSVVRDLPDPTSNTVVNLVAEPVESMGSPIAGVSDAWGQATTFDGMALNPGDVIVAYDPDNVPAGVGPDVLQGDGTYLLHINGDDFGTPLEDEGGESNDPIDFTINGIAAADSPEFLWLFQTSTQTDLTVSSSAIPGATTTGDETGDGAPGTSAFIEYNVTNSGQTSETYDLFAENDEGWTTIILTGAKGVGVALNPGESAKIVVEVQVPGGTPDMTTEVRFHAAAQSYGSANSGAFTNLDITSPADVWDDGGIGIIPDRFSLGQNYPNPFNAATIIVFSLETPGQVRLEVANLLGQKVRTLLNEHRPSGTTSVVWDGLDERGASVPTGIYFYRLIQGTETQVRKMVLLK